MDLYRIFLFAIAATKLKTNGDMDAASQLYEEAMESGSQHPQLLYNIGVFHSEQGDVSPFICTVYIYVFIYRIYIYPLICCGVLYLLRCGNV